MSIAPPRTIAIRNRLAQALLAVLVAGSVAPALEAADARPKPPYFASIGAEKARMRTGPGRTYPAAWVYVRKDLPIRVVDVFKEWRKVEDPAGTQGWMLAALVSSARSAIVAADAPVEMMERRGGGKVLWRAAPGVVGKVSQCGGGWCRFDVRGQAGYVETGGLWGVVPEEVLP